MELLLKLCTWRKVGLAVAAAGLVFAARHLQEYPRRWYNAWRYPPQAASATGGEEIMRLKESLIRGLTTAAEIWFVAAVGIAIGIGAYALAGVAAGLALAILIGLHAVERRVSSVVYRTLTVATSFEKRVGIEGTCRAALSAEGITVQETGYSIDHPTGRCVMTFSIRSENKLACVRVIGPLAEIAGIDRVDLV